MIRISNLKISPKEDKDNLLHKACKKLRLDEKQVKRWSIVKESLDARDKKNIFFIYTIDVEIENESKILRTNKSKDVSVAKNFKYVFSKGQINTKVRPIVVGLGPAGLFAALTLCQMGFKPLVIERGKDVEHRAIDVEHFWQTGELNCSSNVQFGEGGAGTFSDGKLTSRSKDPRSKKVFEEFITAGAPQEIAYVRNPHIGTDKLREVVKKIRETIISMGAEVRFETQLTDFVVEKGKLVAIKVNGSETIPCTDLVLAIGHSARDTFQMLYENKIKISQKPFAMGVRIEHLQEEINKSQYGDFWEESSLGAAEYKLTYRTKEMRSVYTFCMCPGGQVVAASSQEGMLALNGMSYYSREGKNANSAVLVQVMPNDFGSEHPLAGIWFQQELEKRAFKTGGSNYKAPCQSVGSFLGRTNNEYEKIKSTYNPGVQLCDLSEVLPEFMIESLKEAIVGMGKKLKGFDNDHALLTAVESRSSSPIRIERDTNSFESLSLSGLFPVGEGAGYAGGIVSSAIDGILVAEKVFEKYRIE